MNILWVLHVMTSTSAEIKSIATSKFFVHSCNFHSPLLQIQQGQHFGGSTKIEKMSFSDEVLQLIADIRVKLYTAPEDVLKIVTGTCAPLFDTTGATRPKMLGVLEEYIANVLKEDKMEDMLKELLGKLSVTVKTEKTDKGVKEISVAVGNILVVELCSDRVAGFACADPGADVLPNSVGVRQYRWHAFAHRGGQVALLVESFESAEKVDERLPVKDLEKSCI